MVIRTPDYHLRVFVSSTLKELAEERKAVRQAILKLRMAPIMFEIAARPHPAQELYQSYLSQSHIFIGVYWQSYGWIAPQMTVSGLEDEYNLSCNIPRLIYIKNPAPDRDPALTSMLNRIRQDNTSSYTYFSSPAQLKELVLNDLALLLTERFESVNTREQVAERTRVSPPTNVPIPRNPLVGREREFKAICDLLNQEDVALITLTGPGGTGKSRLAIQIGLEMLDRFKDGAYLVTLEAISDLNLVIPAIAEIFNLRENPDSRPIHEILKEYLRDKQMLLLLDNFEHVVEAASDVANLLEACPGLKCIVTSRTPLRLRAEKELPVLPLSTPPLQRVTGHENLSQYPSVELFIQRAQAVRPDFAFGDSNASAVAEICYRLDGLPLAIELAAARIKLLSPRGLLERLDHRFDLLTGGTRDLPERQRTLRRAIDWSYNLLDAMEKKLFRRLSVFNGGFSIEAAEVVCDLNGDLATHLDDALASLIDNNLVVQYQEFECGPRFGMLSTIHEYAGELLSEHEENGIIHRQHAQYFLDFVTDVEPKIRSSERVFWQQVMLMDFGNIREVMEWVYQTRKDIEIGQKMIIRIGMYWQICGYIAEGLQWCNKMLALCDDSTPLSLHAGLLSIKGLLTWAKGDHTQAAEIIDLSLRMSRNQDEYGPLSRALMFHGMLDYAARDLDTAAGMFQEAIEIFRKSNDLWSEAISLSFLGDVTLYQKGAESARGFHNESIRLARQQGDPWCLMPALMSCAQMAIVNNDLDLAYPMLGEIIDVLNITGDHWSRAWTLIDLGHATYLKGDLHHASAHFMEAMSIANTFGNHRALIVALTEGAALIAAHSGGDPAELTLAANLCGVTAPYFKMPGIFLWFNTQKLYEDSVSCARSLMDAELWQKGFAEGNGIPIDRAVELAVQALEVI